MKRWIVLLIGLVLTFALAACSADHAGSSQNYADNASETESGTTGEEISDVAESEETVMEWAQGLGISTKVHIL